MLLYFLCLGLHPDHLFQARTRANFQGFFVFTRYYCSVLEHPAGFPESGWWMVCFLSLQVPMPVHLLEEGEMMVPHLPAYFWGASMMKPLRSQLALMRNRGACSVLYFSSLESANFLHLQIRPPHLCKCGQLLLTAPFLAHLLPLFILLSTAVQESKAKVSTSVVVMQSKV